MLSRWPIRAKPCWRGSPRTGRPLTSVVVWQDRRAEILCLDLSDHEMVAARTGLVLDPYFPTPKMAWLRRNVETGGVVTTSDTWLLHQLTGAFVTDATTASRSMAVELGAPSGAESCSRCSNSTGTASRHHRQRRDRWLHNSVRQQSPGRWSDRRPAGCIARRGVLDSGMAKCTFGTDAFLLANTGTIPVPAWTWIPKRLARWSIRRCVPADPACSPAATWCTRSTPLTSPRSMVSTSPDTSATPRWPCIARRWNPYPGRPAAAVDRPGILRPGDPAPARYRLLMWTDTLVRIPKITVRQDGKVIAKKTLPSPASPDRVFHLSSSVLAKPTSTDVPSRYLLIIQRGR